MFAEKMGRLLFKRIRAPFFYMLVAACPLCVATYLFIEKQSVDLLDQQLQIGRTKAKTAIQRKERKERFVGRHVNPDPYFLSKELEGFVFLKDEQSELKQWLHHPAIAQKSAISQRLHFLESAQNHLVFQEEEIQLSKFYKETLEKQNQPVDVDVKDLKELLGLIEDLPSDMPSLQHRPQLIISEFSLRKKQTPLDRQVFELKIDLFKREFLSP